MKKAIVNSVIILFSTLVSVLLLYSCTEEFDYGKSVNAVNTIESSAVLQTTANVSGNIITDNGAGLTARGICYGTNNNPTITGLKKPDSQAYLGSFTCTLINLAPSTIYFVRAYATNSYGTAYGKEITFKTLAATIPIISSTTAVGFITQTSAVAGGTITNSGASNVSSRGVCYSSTATIPTIANTKTNNGTGIGTFVSSLVGLTANTTYYIRAYATNGVGTAYGDIKSFSTTTATIPTGITTTTASTITQTSATSGGNISNDGGNSITSRGVCWSNTTTSPTILNSKSIDGTGVGAYLSNLTTLLPGTTYYVRAYATNNFGTAYGNTISFTTVAATIPIGITTNTLSLITQTTALGGGNINSDGGATVTSRGVCWSNINSNPTISNTKTIDGSGTGAFSSSLIGLIPGTTYYVRAYATNSAGTAYGSMKSFTTQSATIPQGIITTTASSISQSVATSGGSITSDGGATITMKGVCWSSTTSTPTISNANISNGTGSTSFSSSLSSLTANTTYYIRAYALNSVGIGYGNTVTFTTLPNLAVGQSYQGGIIAYIFVSGDSGYVAGQTHGLIATTSNQSTGAQWGCSGTSINTSTSIGTGQTNTILIVNGCSTLSIAAKICNDLILSGYSNWYLPSYFELEKLYINRNLIGGFSSTNYWSSSQNGTTAAYSLNFSTGGTVSTSKTSAIHVRAIRKF
jgi:hypothetical protein